MNGPTRIPVAIQGDPFAAGEVYEMEVRGIAVEGGPIYPTRARVTLRTYSIMTPAGCVTWRFPESIEILEHGKAPVAFGFDLTMTPPDPAGEGG